MATTPYEIDYQDPRFTKVEADKDNAINEMNNQYNQMVGQTDQFYDSQIQAAKDYATQQQQIQQQNTDFAVEQVNQQKDKAQKDYTKEQSGSYVDWQKQSGQYGANAEQMAAQGLQNTGFSESSQVSMYNTYQNRVSVARESYNNAVLNYDNAIKDAQLQNNSKLAEIAYQALQSELELSLSGFQYKNTLLEQQMAAQREVENTYYSRYQDVLAQMNTENSMAEQIRQYNENLQLQRDELTEQTRQFEQNYSLEVQQYEESIRQFDQEIARLKAKDTEEAKQAAAQLALQKQQLAENKRQADLDYKLEKQRLAEQKRQFDLELKESKRATNLSASRSSGSSGSSGSSYITKSTPTTKTSSTKKTTTKAATKQKAAPKSFLSTVLSSAARNIAKLYLKI